MPQFDILTIGAQLFGLLTILYCFYYYSINTVLPQFIEIKKFRTKKMTKNDKLIKKITTDITSNLWVINFCYKKFLNK
jgi:hypothetical protein